MSADELPPLVRFLIESADERYVVAPRLEGPLHWLVSDLDGAAREAGERLEVVLDHFRSMDAPSEGDVGDDFPITAMRDAVSHFKPDHILIALRTGREGWQERRLIDQVRQQFHVPITVFEIDQTGHVPPPDLSD